MQLHLVIPGLLWPSKVLRDTTYDLDLPALSWLLGRGRHAWLPARAPEDVLCHAFGIEDNERNERNERNELPHAALRLLGESDQPGEPGTAIWLCADPVHLSIEQRRITLAGDAPTANDAEIREIAAALAPFLADVGVFRAGMGGRGYLRLPALPDITTTPPSAAVGYQSMLPQGSEARRWRQLGNEAQMLLHALPCNTEREIRGQPRLNSLWLWGAGALPAKNERSTRYTHVHGDDPILAGLARWAGIHQQPVTNPAELLNLPATARMLLLLDPLQAPARQYDALHWREALLEVERVWLQPLRHAMTRGRLESLRLTALGDESGLDIKLSRADLLRFWRRPQRLHELQPAETNT